jgi:lysophospholipase L1-like esterase
MAIKANDKRPETGWGEALVPCFNPNGVRIVNRAMNGRSTKSFIAEGRWKSIVDALNPGDYVVIQFGHNDEKTNTPTGVSPSEYGGNLSRFVDEVREKDATPILLTPTARRAFINDTIVDSHGAYPEFVRNLRRQKKVPFVDMLEKSEAVIGRYGQDSSAALYLHLAPGQNPNYPNGLSDDTHFSPLGAREMAGIFVDYIRAADIGLRSQLRSCPARP